MYLTQFITHAWCVPYCWSTAGQNALFTKYTLISWRGAVWYC